jgi:hypothetical protein
VTIALILKIVFRIKYTLILLRPIKIQWVFCDLENNNANNDKHKKVIVLNVSVQLYAYQKSNNDGISNTVLLITDEI